MARSVDQYYKNLRPTKQLTDAEISELRPVSRNQQLIDLLYAKLPNVDSWTMRPEGSQRSQLVDVELGSREYRNAVQFCSYIVPVGLQRVENIFLYAQYMLKKEQKEFNEVKLYHNTWDYFIQDITTYNLNWRRAKRRKYGLGISFSPFVRYASLFGPQIGVNCLCVCKVIISREIEGSKYTKMPPQLYDTTTDGQFGNVKVKYEDNDFFPEYVLYWKLYGYPGGDYDSA